MARDLLSQGSLQATLDRIAYHSVELVEGCDVAGILSVRDRTVRTLAGTHELVWESDRLQSRLSEGPCFDAARDRQEVYRIADLTEETPRWPSYAPAARDLGVGSMMGFLLFTDDENLGALNLYSREADAFTEDSESVGWLLASHAAVAFSSAAHDAQLREAVATRQEIGEAIGILIERYKVDEHRAFDLLRKVSQDSNVKLREVAGRVVRSGELPESG